MTISDAEYEALVAERDRWRQAYSDEKGLREGEERRADHLVAERDRLAADRDEMLMALATAQFERREVQAYLEDAEAERDRLAAELEVALHRAEGWVQHDTEAYAAATSRAIARAEAAEARADRLAAQFSDEAIDRAGKEPIVVDISDYSDEFVAGFLAGQKSILEEVARAALAASSGGEA